MFRLNCILLLVICCMQNTNGQELDSIRHYNINEVQIVESRNQYFIDDRLVTRIDSAIKAVFSSVDINELLSYITPSVINNYGGYGSASSIQMRGSGVNHTLVSWNGIPMNSITLGSMDLSMIPVSFADEIALTHGAAGSLSGSGTFGGLLDLNNKADWQNRLSAEVNIEGRNYHNMGADIKFSKGNSRFQYNTQLFYRQGENDFKYRDTYKFGHPESNIEHNAYLNAGLMQNVFARLDGGHHIEGGLWIQNKYKEIPNILGDYGQANAFQEDRTIKAYLSWKKTFAHSVLELKTSYLKDFQRYTDKELSSDSLFSVESDILTHRIYSELNYKKYFTEKLVVDAGAYYSQLKGIVSSYVQEKTENQGALYSAAKYYLKNIILNISLRQEFNEFVIPAPLFSTGLTANIFNKRILIRMNVSNKFRLPTFNEKYWKPGGNPDLLPERGWSTEAGIESMLAGSREDNNYINLNSTVYSSQINNWIQWIPGNPYWFPVNYKKVWARGIENAVDIRINNYDWTLYFNLSYNYCRSTNVETYDNNSSITGKQLRYIPFHTAKSYMSFKYMRWQFGLLFSYTGGRHTSMDNNPLYLMDDYFVSDIHLHKSFQLKKLECIFKFRVNNLLNVRYQVVKSYPMPGRMIYTGIIFKINNKIRKQ